MCGIMGYVGLREAAPILLDGLRRLEYRGYDSAGIAVLGNDGFHVVKDAGKIATLAARLEGIYPQGTTGLGHTRWATHGRPNTDNAHPHRDCTRGIVVIHNGIVENYRALKAELREQGHTFASETDTEVIPHLLEAEMARGACLADALQATIARLEGAHAIVTASAAEPGRLVAARVGNAGGVVVGYGEGEMFLASDLPALLTETRRVVFLADREVAELTPEGARYRAPDGRAIEKEPQPMPYDPVAAAKGNYKHFMLKEIMEQPEGLADTLGSRVLFDPPEVLLDEIGLTPETLRSLRRVVLVGMGTSLHAAMVGRYYMEQIAGLPAEVDNSSEFRYREPLLDDRTLVVSVSQSGETVDTLAAMDEASRRGARQVTVCNVPGSQASRLADGVIYTRCGLEIGVCSTKTFTASVAALYMLACHLGRIRGVLDNGALLERLEPLARMPQLLGQALTLEPQCDALAAEFFRCQNFIYLARGVQFPLAMEGALKLKEVSYIHAEGYPAGEMKHGPIALIDRLMPIVAIAPQDGLRDKMLSNIEQVKARGGTVIVLATEGDEEIAAQADQVVYLPPAPPLLQPLLAAVPMQLLAYHIALRRGCDVDQPRNLAPTVTVE